MLCNNLTDSQCKAIIILLYKEEDSQLISSWRPISLICVDSKIIAKVISWRLNSIVHKFISEEQYCCGKKSIIECNNTTRDLIYYTIENRLTGAMINIDLRRAFDSVDHNFLFKNMEKMGFSEKLISWIKVLYSGIESMCLVNGHLGECFKVKTGVRQGCPLSMTLYVISQEPLYLFLRI